MDLNINVNGRSVSTAITFCANQPYLTRRGVEDILQQWCDRPSRSWMEVEVPGSVEFVIARTDDSYGVVMSSFQATELDSSGQDWYSLDALASSLDSNDIAWGRAIGEPDLDVQERVLSAMRQRADGVGIPDSWESLEALVLLSLGDAL